MISQVIAAGFRNLQPLDWCPAPRSNLLLGENGAGKTSLLEAVYLVATTRSFRTNDYRSIVNLNYSHLCVVAEIKNERRTRLEVGCEDGARTRRVNGHVTTLSEHLAILPIVSWSSSDAELLTGLPGARRRFLDRGIVGTCSDGLEILGKYRQILAHKRQLLLEGKRGTEPWNDLLAQISSNLISIRKNYIKKLTFEINEIINTRESAFPKIVVNYRPSFATEDPELIRQELEKLASRESDRRRPLAGPHLDDFSVYSSNIDVKKFSSSGQLKFIGLILLAAHGRILEREGKKPVYLLDDFDSELSSATLRRIWSIFSSPEQLLVTSNRPEVWDQLSVEQTWKVDSGKISQL